jgi:hypothetical protein
MPHQQDQTFRSHADRADQQFTPDPPTLFGQLYPQEGVLAVVPNLSAAETVCAALVRQGILDNEAQVLTGLQFAEATSATTAARSID